MNDQADSISNLIDQLRETTIRHSLGGQGSDRDQDFQYISKKPNFQPVDGTIDENRQIGKAVDDDEEDIQIGGDNAQNTNREEIEMGNLSHRKEEEKSERDSDGEVIKPEDDAENEQDPTKFYANGKWHTFSERSLFVFSKHNGFRKLIVKVITHKWFDTSITTLILINSLFLGIKDYTDVDNVTKINRFVDELEIFFVVAFAIECMCKIIGMGFVGGEGSYLADAWNWLDFIVVISSLLTEIPQMKSVSGMRTFRLMRPLRSLTTMPSMRILISTLLASVAQLGGVLILAIFFFTIFAILGVSLWSGKIYNRCRLTEFPVDGDWPTDDTNLELCSDVNKCPENRWCGSLAEASRSDDTTRYDLSKVDNIWRDTEIEDLNFGYSSFNHLPSAFLTIFQCITLEGWINVTNMYEDAYEIWFVDVYFVLCIIVCSFFVLNLTIAVMLLKYEDFDKSEKGSEHLEELHEYGVQIGLPERFVEFIIEQDNINISQKGLRILKNQKQDSIWQQLIKSTVTFDKDDSYYNNRLTRFMFYMVNSPIFNGLITFIIVLNTIALSMEKFPEHDPNTTTARMLTVGNLVFTIIFTVEVILKLIGLGFKGYCSDTFNLFDAFIVMVSIMEMALAVGDEESGDGGGAFSALRAFRLFRIFKIFRAGDLRTLLDSIAFTIMTIKDYTILLSLFIYVFALLGMSFFAGLVKFNDDGDMVKVVHGKPVDPNGASPRANFDILGWSALTVFEIMIGENWNGVMYDHMRTVGEASCIFFIGLVIFGNIIMLNLFLAILLGNFDRARNFGEKKKIFDAFESLSKMGYKLNIAIAYLFDDQDFARYIEKKILVGKDKPLVIQTNSIEEENQMHQEYEIKQIYCAMIQGQIVAILAGDKKLEDQEIDETIDYDLSPQQREKTIEILNYVKRQTNLQKQRLEFHEELKKNQEQRDALDKIHVEEEVLSTESDKSTHSLTFFEAILNHIQNSSLLIFPQNSRIRMYCQLCVQSEDDQEAVAGKEPKNEGQGHGQNEASMMSPQNNKVSPMENGGSDLSMQKRQRINKSVSMREKSNSQLQALAQSDQLQLNKSDSLKQGSSAMGALSKSAMVQNTNSKKALKPKKNVASKIFEGVIMTLIIISSITLVIDNPLQDPESDLIVFVGYLDNCFTVLFTIEALVKIIAMGFLFNNQVIRDKGMQPYIRNPWNMLDFVVVVASLIDFIVILKTKPVSDMTKAVSSNQAAVASSLQSVKALRALRALRPLRMISRNKGMKLIVNALLSSLPSMTNVTIVCCLFLLIFAIMGVDWFKGQFDFCSIDDPQILAEIISKQDCLDRGGQWINPKETFDNSLLGFRTLFEMMSTEGWIDVMNAGLDSVKPVDGMQMQPKENNSMVSIVYFVVFMIFGSQFILNLFVGVIMDNFNKIKEKEEWGSLFVTEDQRCWIDAQRLGLSQKLVKKIDPPPGSRGQMFHFVNHPLFEGVITFFIALNTMIMAIKFDGMAPRYETIFENLNYFFAFIFNCEMIFKLIGLGYQYFYSAWNLFDCTVVIGTDIGILLNFISTGSSFSTAATVVRAFRIMRIVRLVRSQENIKIILDTLVNIIPQITNFIALMFLLLFIYAALGINLFSGVVLQEYVTAKNNFQNISVAIMYLFRCSTGEDWNKIMHELAIVNIEGECIDDQDYETLSRNEMQVLACGSNFSYFYFLSFTIIIAWLIMNLSVAAVIEGLENAKQQNSGTVSGDDVQNLLDAWQEYDPKATGWITVHDLVCLIIELPPPFGNPELNKMCKFSQKQFDEAKNLIYNQESFYINEEKLILIKNKDIIKLLTAYKIRTYEGLTEKVHFKDIYQILVKRVFIENFPDFEISKYLRKKMKNQWLEKHKKFKELPKTGYKIHQSFASQIITSYARRFKYRREQAALRTADVGNIEGEHKFDISPHKEPALRSEEIPGMASDKPVGTSGLGERKVNSILAVEPNQIESHSNSKKSNVAPSLGQGRVADNPQLGDAHSGEEGSAERHQLFQFNRPGTELAEDVRSQSNQESLIGSAQNHAIRMGQSITDSNIDKTDLHFLAGKAPEENNLILEPPNIDQESRKNMSVNEFKSGEDLRDSVNSHNIRGVSAIKEEFGEHPPTIPEPRRQSPKEEDDAEMVNNGKNFFME